jgi:hypothetical protein
MDQDVETRKMLTIARNTLIPTAASRELRLGHAPVKCLVGMDPTVEIRKILSTARDSHTRMINRIVQLEALLRTKHLADMVSNATIRIPVIAPNTPIQATEH